MDRTVVIPDARLPGLSPQRTISEDRWTLALHLRDSWQLFPGSFADGLCKYAMPASTTGGLPEFRPSYEFRSWVLAMHV